MDPIAMVKRKQVRFVRSVSAAFSGFIYSVLTGSVLAGSSAACSVLAGSMLARSGLAFSDSAFSGPAGSGFAFSGFGSLGIPQVLLYRLDSLDKRASFAGTMSAQFLQGKAGVGGDLNKAGKNRKTPQVLNGNNLVLPGIVDKDQQFPKGKKPPPLPHSQNSLAQPFSDHLLVLPHLKQVPKQVLQGYKGKNYQKKERLLSDTSLLWIEYKKKGGGSRRGLGIGDWGLGLLFVIFACWHDAMTTNLAP